VVGKLSMRSPLTDEERTTIRRGFTEGGKAYTEVALLIFLRALVRQLKRETPSKAS
jgi:hypothetical protein